MSCYNQPQFMLLTCHIGCVYTAESLERKGRAVESAREKGVEESGREQ